MECACRESPMCGLLATCPDCECCEDCCRCDYQCPDCGEEKHEGPCWGEEP